MKPPLYVIDTHVLAWFAKGWFLRLGSNAFVVMIHPRARIIIPSYALMEIERRFAPRKICDKNSIRVPPTALLRLINKCSNARILPNSPAVLASEFRLRREKRTNWIPDQDIPIAAAVMFARQHYDGPVALITKDGPLTKWAQSQTIPVLWDKWPFELLPR